MYVGMSRFGIYDSRCRSDALEALLGTSGGDQRAMSNEVHIILDLCRGISKRNHWVPDSTSKVSHAKPTATSKTYQVLGVVVSGVQSWPVLCPAEIAKTRTLRSGLGFSAL